MFSKKQMFYPIMNDGSILEIYALVLEFLKNTYLQKKLLLKKQGSLYNGHFWQTHVFIKLGSWNFYQRLLLNND